MSNNTLESNNTGCDMDRLSSGMAELNAKDVKPVDHLLNLPFEIRDKINKALLVKHGNVYLHCDWKPDAVVWNESIKVNSSITPYLRTCKQLEKEGTDVLYGANTFVCYHVRVFKNPFLYGKGFGFGGIGKRNVAKIQRVQFGLPMRIIQNTQDSIEGNAFLDFMCNDLVGLQQMCIKTHCLDYLGAAFERETVRSSMALLATASRMVKYHPTLRKAIWKRESVGRGAAGSQLLRSDFYIEPVSIGFETTLEGSVTRLDPWAQEFTSVDILLDTARIRKTHWEQANTWNNVNNFAIDNSLLLQPVDKSELAIWPGEAEYEPLLEYDVTNQAAIVDVRRGRYIHGVFIPGGFVNGVFVKGEWTRGPNGDLIFHQGKMIPARMVDGKMLDEVFVGGQWVSDDNFVEGKFVNGKLVKGVWFNYDEDKFFEGALINGLFIKGRWEGEEFVEGMHVGRAFYVGKWLSNGAFVRGNWTNKPRISKLSGTHGRKA